MGLPFFIRVLVVSPTFYGGEIGELGRRHHRVAIGQTIQEPRIEVEDY
ncbi:MAG TPA: hypothetical protein VJ719_09525 [Chthoniobacterales bacterium]|nr:hypothetical protein [Chthoniobacterales bacterium]